MYFDYTYLKIAQDKQIYTILKYINLGLRIPNQNYDI